MKRHVAAATAAVVVTAMTIVCLLAISLLGPSLVPPQVTLLASTWSQAARLAVRSNTIPGQHCCAPCSRYASCDRCSRAWQNTMADPIAAAFAAHQAIIDQARTRGITVTPRSAADTSLKRHCAARGKTH